MHLHLLNITIKTCEKSYGIMVSKLEITQVTRENQNFAIQYLQAHEGTTLMLASNLRDRGPYLNEHHNSGNFKLITRNSMVVGVFCLTRRGNLLAQSDVDAADLILESCKKEPIEVKGFLGDWETVYPIARLYEEQHRDFRPSHESKEILYRYVLKSGDTSIQHDPRVRFLETSDFENFFLLNQAYLEELNLPNDISKDQRIREFNQSVSEKCWWGLFLGKDLVSIAALNSHSNSIGQVGGVFTSKTFRQKGYSKANMSHLLKDCRDYHHHRKSILFTGESDIPAQKLYESLGYKKIGNFGLILKQS